MECDVEQFKKDFGILEDLCDIKFIQIKKENYKNEEHQNAFGEKLCTLYTANFCIFNIFFSMRILVFIYENSCEVLKLDLRVDEVSLEKEIAVCRNFLQRHRNLNSTFLTLKKFSRFFESRRLIVDIVLNKEPRVSLQKNTDDGSLTIKYINDSPNIFIEIGWKIEWSLKNCDIIDVIEVYYNDFDLPNYNFIKAELESLTHPSMDFAIKLKLWKQLFSDLSKYDTQIQATVIISDNEPSDHILVISDSEDDRNCNEDIIHRRKRRKLQNQVSSSSSQVINVAD